MLTEAHTVTARQWLWFLGWRPEVKPDPSPNAEEWSDLEDAWEAERLHPRLRELLHPHTATDWDTLMQVGELDFIPLVELLVHYDDPEEMAEFNATLDARHRHRKYDRWHYKAERYQRVKHPGPPLDRTWLHVLDYHTGDTQP